MKKYNLKEKYMFLAIFFSVIFIGICYGRIGDINLNIGGNLNASFYDSGVVITSVSVSSISNGSSLDSYSINKSLLESKIILGNSSDAFLELEITVENRSSSKRLFSSIIHDITDDIFFYDNHNIIFEVDEDEINEDTVISSLDELTFHIKFMYDDTSNIDNNELNSFLKIEFTQPGAITLADIYNDKEFYYGKKVTNYNMDGLTYRIFFVDKATTEYPNGKYGDIAEGEDYHLYLKADALDSMKIKPEGFISAYHYSFTPGGRAEYVLSHMNREWWEARGDYVSEWLGNEKAVAYFCDPDKWTKYVNDDALYAIGSPSVEMFVDSYNSISHYHESTVRVLGAHYRTNGNAFGYYYTLVPGSVYNNGGHMPAGQIDYIGTYHNIYTGRNGGQDNSFNWWLASPSFTGADAICYSGGNGRLDNGNYKGNGTSYSPLVSMKASYVVEIDLEE